MTNAVPMPRLGAELDGGRFAGIVHDQATNEDVALVDLGISENDMTHAKAAQWAKGKGGALPTREEARVLWANLDTRATVTISWFWTGTQYAGDEAYAWFQGFNDGYQGDYRTDDKLRARAVRRLPLQPFTPSAS